MSTPPAPSDEDRLHALVDGRLPPADAAAARAALGAQAVADADAWQGQRAELRELHAGLLQEPLPAPLAAAAERLQARLDARRAWWRLGGLAASVLLAFLAGWLGRAQMDRNAASGPALAQAAPLQRFAHAATVAHALYQPEVRHPVEVPAAQQEHLVQWLGKRLGRPIHVPDLHEAGYELVGGRLLPGDGGARAQFMYQRAGGERITLYLGAVQASAAGPAPASSAAETAFRFEHDGNTSAFYWVDQGFGYALAGNLPRAELLALATLVYRSL